MTDLNIEKYIEELIDDNEIKEEITNFFDSMNNNEQQCYFTAGEFQIAPTVDGLNFLGNYTFPTMINMLIPDLFIQCVTSYYKNPTEKLTMLKTSCPIYTDIFSNNNNKNLNDISVNYYYQKLINKDLIKSLLYFNFTSNFTKVTSLQHRLVFLSQKVSIFLDRKIDHINYSNFTKPEEIFNAIYDKDSIIIQLMEFRQQLFNALDQNKNGTNICNYNIPYLFTFYCINNKEKNCLQPLNTITSDKTLYTMSYSDLYYLSNAKWALPVLISNINKLLNSRIPPDEIENFINNITYSNIFTVFDIVAETYDEILSEISFILQKKTIIPLKYTYTSNLLECLFLYYNYVSNEIFLINNSGINEHISNIYLEDIKNTIKFFIDLINS